MIGFWLGDNCSSREGTKFMKNGKRTSGRFGVISNDKEVILRFLSGMRSELKIERIKIDVQIPRNFSIDEQNIKDRVAKEFGVTSNNIIVYKGSSWRRKIGYAVYTNDTTLQRYIYQEIYIKMFEMIEMEKIDVSALLQGICDAEGCVDKANKVIRITNKDPYLIKIIEKCIEMLHLKYKKRIKKDKIRILITSINDFKEKVGFFIKRKQKDLEEMIVGNFLREKDMSYLEKFKILLLKGTTAKEISKKLNIPYSTVRLALRNLTSAGLVKRKRDKNNRGYFYYL
jgi:DNA-binding transcriptional ArsR family regulator